MPGEFRSWYRYGGTITNMIAESVDFGSPFLRAHVERREHMMEIHLVVLPELRSRLGPVWCNERKAIRRHERRQLDRRMDAMEAHTTLGAGA